MTLVSHILLLLLALSCFANYISTCGPSIRASDSGLLFSCISIGFCCTIILKPRMSTYALKALLQSTCARIIHLTNSVHRHIVRRWRAPYYSGLGKSKMHYPLTTYPHLSPLVRLIAKVAEHRTRKVPKLELTCILKVKPAFSRQKENLPLLLHQILRLNLEASAKYDSN